jgi:AMP-binding enzyme
MILDDSSATNAGERTTLDELFRRAASRHPDPIALIDPPNRGSFTDGAPRELTYGQADRLISAIAGRLRRIGLSTDAVIGVQCPNTVESILLLLAILRAGMIATPLPLLWRQADCISALSRVGAKALVTVSRIGQVDHCQLAMQVAAKIFSIRYVCGLGSNLADGIIPLDDLPDGENPDLPSPFEGERKGNPAAHVAIVTWEVTSEGLVPVARNHLELLAGGAAVVLESRIAQDAAILSSIATTSFAGIALTILPWLFSGGTLTLHQPFDAQILAEQLVQPCDLVVLPAPLLPRLLDARILSARTDIKTILAVWRSPERLTQSAVWPLPEIALLDVPIFGETALFAIRRNADGKPARLPIGAVVAPRGDANAVQIAEIRRSEPGGVALGGAMVPRHSFPPTGRRAGAVFFRPAENGLIDAGYTCRIELGTRSLVVTGPPPGIVSVGGYRFVLQELQDMISHVQDGATLTALPDTLSGHRLAGHAGDRAALREALTRLGVNPLVVRAFRDREQSTAA